MNFINSNCIIKINNLYTKWYLLDDYFIWWKIVYYVNESRISYLLLHGQNKEQMMYILDIHIDIIRGNIKKNLFILSESKNNHENAMIIWRVFVSCTHTINYLILVCNKYIKLNNILQQKKNAIFFLKGM